MTTQQKKWTAGVVVALLVLMLATNPDQASHLRAIKDTSDLKPRQPYAAVTISISDFMPQLSYNNYFLFSTTTLIGGVVSWGMFGKVYTTNRISDPFGTNNAK